MPVTGGSLIPGTPQTPLSATTPVMGSGGQTPGNIVPMPEHARQIPPAGASPIPGAPQTPPSAILPGPGGQSPGSRPLANQPTSSSSGTGPTKPTVPSYGGSAPAAQAIPVEGKMHLPNLIDKFWMRYIIITITNAA